MNEDHRLFYPATARNRDPIRQVLERHLPATGLVLEVGSGSGEHITYFAESAAENCVFQPSDPELSARMSIDDWANHLALSNVRPAVDLQIEWNEWPVQNADILLCINVLHITPWSTCVSLFHHGARVLKQNGVLFLYGPFRRNGAHTSEGNGQFDAQLRAQNPAFGIRDLEAIVDLAGEAGFAPPAIESMPTNNLSLIFARQ